MSTRPPLGDIPKYILEDRERYEQQFNDGFPPPDPKHWHPTFVKYAEKIMRNDLEADKLRYACRNIKPISKGWIEIPEWPRDGAKVEFYIYRTNRTDPIIGIYKQHYFFEDKDPIHPTHIKRWRYVEEPRQEKPSSWKPLDPDNLPRCPVLVRDGEYPPFVATALEARRNIYTHQLSVAALNCDGNLIVTNYCEIPL